MSFYDHRKLALTAKPIAQGGFPPTLKADFYNGNPQLFVLTGVKKGEGVTYIRAGIEPKTADLICEAIKYIADLPADPENNITATFECKAGKEKELVAKIVVGKNKTGSMFISIIDAKNSTAPMIQFFFGTDLFHPVTYKSVAGSEEPKALSSCLAAKGWAERTRSLWYKSLMEYDPSSEEKKPSGGYGNQNKGNGYTAPTDSSFDDDVW